MARLLRNSKKNTDYSAFWRTLNKYFTLSQKEKGKADENVLPNKKVVTNECFPTIISWNNHQLSTL
jgi:hypothetical protein